MDKLILILAFVLSGCWGGPFYGADGSSDFEGVAGAAGEPGQGHVSDVGPSSTTASGPTSGGGSASTGASTDGTDTAGFAGEPSDSATAATSGSGECTMPGLDALDSWDAEIIGVNGAVVSRICGNGSADGRILCAGAPCDEWSFRIDVVPWTADGLTFKLTYRARDDWQVAMFHECSVAVECDYTLSQPYDTQYMLELRRTENGYAVKSLYTPGGDPASSTHIACPIRQRSGPLAEPDCRGTNLNGFLTDPWGAYLDWVLSLEWDCNGNLIGQ